MNIAVLLVEIEDLENRLLDAERERDWWQRHAEMWERRARSLLRAIT